MTHSAQTLARRQPGSPGPTRRATHAGRSSKVFLFGVAIIALHVADDNFLQPNAGSSVGDHMLSGLIPLGSLAALTALSLVLPPGGRAVCAVLTGAFGLAASSEAAYYTSQGALSGDDITGWLCAPAGVVLIVLGLVTLWESRRRTGHLVLRVLRRGLLTVVALAVGQFIVYPVSMAYVHTHVMRVGVPEPASGLVYEDVELTTSDGLRLAGWYVPSDNGAAVIVAGGRINRQDHVRMLTAHGYGVLIFDRRGEGASEGDPNVLGWGGDRDIKAAITFLQGRPDVDPDRIGGLGISVGGEMLLETAAETGALRAVLSEGAGARSYREVSEVSTGSIVDRAVFVVHSAAVRVFSNEPVPPKLSDLVGEIAPAAVFFVYGEEGQLAEKDLNPTYYETARQPKDVWEVPEAEHVAGLSTQPEDYERRVIEFFDVALEVAD